MDFLPHEPAALHFEYADADDTPTRPVHFADVDEPAIGRRPIEDPTPGCHGFDASAGT